MNYCLKFFHAMVDRLGKVLSVIIIITAILVAGGLYFYKEHNALIVRKQFDKDFKLQEEQFDKDFKSMQEDFKVGRKQFDKDFKARQDQFNRDFANSKKQQ